MSKLANVRKLATPIASGDWHDAPMKWEVVGPEVVTQLFRTKRNATIYAKLIREFDFAEAQRRFVKTA